jgi:glycine C-acetyltransferase
MAAALDQRGIYVAAFFYPVVPKGNARIRTQMSAALTEKDVELASRPSRTRAKRLGDLMAKKVLS